LFLVDIKKQSLSISPIIIAGGLILIYYFYTIFCFQDRQLSPVQTPPSLGLSKRRRDDVTGDVTLHTRVNGRRRSPERNYGDVTTGIVVLLI